MSVFYVMRKAFADRTYSVKDLSSFTEMLGRWYVTCAGGGPEGGVYCEARIFSFARGHGKAIQDALAVRLPETRFDTSDPDELRVIGSMTPANGLANTAVWREVLTEPRVQDACVMLRITFDGPMRRFDGILSEGTATFVICGAPADGGILVKAMWRLGRDESMGQVYPRAKWHSEDQLLNAFDVFREQCERGDRDGAARLAMANLTANGRTYLFIASPDERKVMRLIRRRTDMPDSRGVGAFLRRLAWPLLGGVLFAIGIFLFWSSAVLSLVCIVMAAVLLISAGRIVWKKMRRVYQYYTRMRRTLIGHHAAAVEYRVIDLSGDRTPTLVKFSRDIMDRGARHICDLSITTAKRTLDSNRIYAIDGATVSLGLLRTAESYAFFPPKAILLAATRFRDERVHCTYNQPMYRKPRPGITGRCLLSESGVDELLALHQRQVDKLIAAGAVPVPAALDAAEAIERMRASRERAPEKWKKSPYSWGDALHDAFKVCRREYLRD